MFGHEAFAQLDWVVIETTGMTDPAPLIQSLYMDPECQARLRLDSVLTVVDCKHLPVHLRTATKRNNGDKGTDPSTGTGDKDPLPAGIKSIFKISSANPADQPASSPIPEAVLQISFADRILMNKTDLVSEEELNMLFKSVQKINPSARLIACQNSLVPIEELLNIRAFDPLQNKALLNPSQSDVINSIIQVDANGKILNKQIKFGPEMSKQKSKKMQLSAEGAKIRSKHTVNTVSLVCEKPLDLDRFNVWISTLLAERGPDIYRIKCLLSLN